MGQLDWAIDAYRTDSDRSTFSPELWSRRDAGTPKGSHAARHILGISHSHSPYRLLCRRMMSQPSPLALFPFIQFRVCGNIFPRQVGTGLSSMSDASSWGRNLWRCYAVRDRWAAGSPHTVQTYLPVVSPWSLNSTSSVICLHVSRADCPLHLARMKSACLIFIEWPPFMSSCPV